MPVVLVLVLALVLVAVTEECRLSFKASSADRYRTQSMYVAHPQNIFISHSLYV